MISSRYLFPVVLLVLVWAGSLWAVYDYACSRLSSSPQHASQHLLYEEIIDEISAVRLRDLRKTEDSLEDDSKAKFRPIIPVLYQVGSLQKEVLADMEQSKRSSIRKNLPFLASPERLANFTKISQRALEEMATSAQELIREYGHEFDLSKTDIADFNQDFQDIVSSFKTTSGANLLAMTFQTGEERFALLELDFRLRALQIQSKLRRVHGGKVISCFPPPLLPYLDSYDLVAKQGTKHALDFGISDYTSTINPDNILLVVGKDTVQFFAGRVTSVPVSTQKPGKHKIDTKLIIINPLTGRKSVNEASFHYYVE